MNIKEKYAHLESGFFGFWVKNRRISFLVMALIIGLGTASLVGIPKESSPSINFGIIQVGTLYPGVNPVDMDNLITEEIEKAVKDIEGINKIESTSQVGFSSTILTLDNEANTRDVLTDVKAEVDKVFLPSDAEDPNVSEISTDSEVMFQALLYGDRGSFPMSRLKSLAQITKDSLEGKYGIDTISIEGGSNFDLQVQVDQSKVEQLGLNLQQIASAIRDYNTNTPLGNFEIDSLKYDFRIDGELTDEQELLQIPLNSQITLGDIAIIARKYEDTSIRSFGLQGEQGYNVVTLTINKVPGGNIFAISAAAKSALESLFSNSDFDGVLYVYGLDLSETIKEDYVDLGKSGLMTLVGVFLCLLLFVGFKEALIATFAIPLAFMVTFVVLEQIDLSLNFLTNFSLVLTLGIAIDTTIVIIEAAYENLKLGFNPKTAVLMAVKDFSAPLIAGTSTTLVVFIPMMVLPGILGKFLAYIPITVFITLIAALFISLTVNSALFYKLSKKKTRFVSEESIEKFLSQDAAEILALERVGKIEKDHTTKSLRQRMLDGFSSWYERVLRRFISNKKSRLLSILVPIVLLILSFVFLSPKIGFTLFPGSDNGSFSLVVEDSPGSTTEKTGRILGLIEAKITDIPELKQYTISVDGNRLSAVIELLPLAEREREGLREVFEVEQEVLEKLSFLTAEGLTLESLVEEGGPPAGKPVGLKLITDDNNKFSELVQVAKDFAAELRTIQGTRNVSISSKDTPGQFIFSFDKSKLAALGLTPSDVTSQVGVALNGASAGSIALDSVDASIKVIFESLVDSVSPSDIQNIKIVTQQGLVPVSEVMSYGIDNSVGAISRIDTKVTIKVDADLEQEFVRQGTVLQNNFVQRAEQYDLPEGVSFDAAGESDENAELIAAAGKGLAIALFLMLVILVLQFNSFLKPVIILYSVFLALLGVNIGLYLTGNPYSMSFGIGFIALMGIVVNDAIIFIDKINKNMDHGVDTFESIVEAGRSRLQPIVLTTLTTLLGVLPIALQDPFWAGLGYTMIFGLFAGSAMTLFVIPSLYYMVFVKKEGSEMTEKRKRNRFGFLNVFAFFKKTKRIKKLPL